MRIALVADAYPPMRTSAAVQLRDLAQAFSRQGHLPTVIIPSADIAEPFTRETCNGIDVLRLRSVRTKDIGHLRRVFGEMLMPFVMLRNFRRSPLARERWDGVVWYSPSIFFGSFVNWLKKRSACRSYLILRDIFPEWAVDMGLMRRGPAYHVLKRIERYQYAVADTIGVQTEGNLAYFDDTGNGGHRRVEVLQNWLADVPDLGCSIAIDRSPLARRRIFVYAGNMGVAQGMDVLMGLAERLRGRQDIGFLFIGRGSEAQRLRNEALDNKLNNVMFHDEISPEEIVGLYRQCHVGLVSLDPRHRTHNIPGKFLSYMQAGLPVLASVNAGNDLFALIERERVGLAITDHSVDSLERMAFDLIAMLEAGTDFGERCRNLARSMFAPSEIVRQIIIALGASERM